MSDERLDLDAIRERSSKATKGPWCVEPQTWGAADGETTGLRIEGVVGAFLLDDPAEAEQQRRNFAFIARARDDVPRLVAEVERLRRIEAAAKLPGVSEALSRGIAELSVTVFQASLGWSAGDPEASDVAIARASLEDIATFKAALDRRIAAIDDAGEERR